MQPHRGNSFDALRLAAAFMVFHSHQSVLTGRPANNLPWIDTAWSGVGVGMFFAMSGYLVTQSILRDPDLLTFYWRRVVRIMPGLAVNVLFCVALGAWLTTLPLEEFAASPVTFEFLRNNLLLAVYDPRYALPGVFAGNVETGVNGSLWTLPYEIAMYVVLGLALCAARERAVRVCIVLIALAATFAIMMVQVYSKDTNYVFQVWNWLTTKPLGIYGFLFFLGAMFALAGNLRHSFAFAAAASFVLYWGDTNLVAAYVALAAVVITVGQSPALKLPARLGDISYGLYLYGFPVQQAVSHFMGQRHFKAQYVIALTITAVLAYVSWRVVERPALQLKRFGRVSQSVATNKATGSA